MAHSCSEKTPSPFSFHAKSMASQSPFARQLPPLTCFLITSKCCSRITPRFLKSESLPSSLNVSRGNDIPFRENAACFSSVQCTYVCNVVYCCTVCCTSTAVLLYGAPPPPQCSYCSRHRLSGRRSYLHPQFTAQLVGACSYWHLGTEHVFLWPCNYYYFLRLKFLTTKFLAGDAVCIVTDIGGTLESYYIDSPVLHQEASLQKICALEKKQAANNVIITSCTPNQATILLLYGLYELPTMRDTSVHSTVVPPLLYVYVLL